MPQASSATGISSRLRRPQRRTKPSSKASLKDGESAGSSDVPPNSWFLCFGGIVAVRSAPLARRCVASTKLRIRSADAGLCRKRKMAPSETSGASSCSSSRRPATMMESSGNCPWTWVTRALVSWSASAASIRSTALPEATMRSAACATSSARHTRCTPATASRSRSISTGSAESTTTFAPCGRPPGCCNAACVPVVAGRRRGHGPRRRIGARRVRIRRIRGVVAGQNVRVIDVHWLSRPAQKGVVTGTGCPRPTGVSILDKIGRGGRDTGRVSASRPGRDPENPHRVRYLRKSVPRVSTGPPYPLLARYRSCRIVRISPNYVNLDSGRNPP